MSCVTGKCNQPKSLTFAIINICMRVGTWPHHDHPHFPKPGGSSLTSDDFLKIKYVVVLGHGGDYHLEKKKLSLNISSKVPVKIV